MTGNEQRLEMDKENLRDQEMERWRKRKDAYTLKTKKVERGGQEMEANWERR